jgi:hypothetical protein
VIECIDIILFALYSGVHFNAEFLVDGLQEFNIGNKGIEQERTPGGSVQVTEKRPADGGFTGTNASYHSDKTLAFVNPVEEMVEGLFVIRAQIEVPRIRC